AAAARRAQGARRLARAPGPGAQSTTQQGAARTQPVAVGTHPAWRSADAGPYRRHASAHRAPGWRNPAGADPRSRSHARAGLARAAARAAAAGGILASKIGR